MPTPEQIKEYHETRCLPPHLQESQTVIATYYGSWEKPTPVTARNWLENFHQGSPDSTFDQLGPLEQAMVYFAVSSLAISDMDKRSHRGDPIRHDRSFGQRLRKNRTGSRFG